MSPQTPVQKNKSKDFYDLIRRIGASLSLIVRPSSTFRS